MISAQSKHCFPIVLLVFCCSLARLVPVAADEPAPPPGVVSVLKGHTETVYAVAFSPDGRYVLTGSFDKSLKLWEAATGKEIKTFAGQAGHQNLVLAAAFSPDGRLIASGGADNTAKLWDTPLSVPLREFAHADAVNAVALSPDSTKLAGAGKDGVVKLWNAADGKQLFSLEGHSGAVNGVTFGGNGQFLASCASDRTVRIWNTANGQSLGTIGAHASAVNAVASSANGNTIFSVGDNGQLKIWKLPVTAPKRLAAQGDALTMLILSADGKTVVTACADKSVQISNFDNGQVIRQWKVLAATVTAVAISTNKATVVAGTVDGRLYLWNAADGKPIREYAAHKGALTGIAFHPQSTQVLTAGADGALKLWNVAPVKKATPTDDKPIKIIDAHKGGVSSVAFHNNGTQVLSGGADKTVKLWNLTNGQVTRAMGPLVDAVQAVAFNRDCTQIGAAVGKVVKTWNVNDAKDILTLAHPAAVASLSFSADKTRIATGAADHQVRVWDATSGSELEYFKHGGLVHSVAFSNSNNAVLSASNDKAAVVNTLSLARAIAASTLPVRGLAVSPSGAHVLTAGDDKTVKLWNIGNGLNERTFTGAEGAVRALAVSRNGILLAAGGTDKNVRIYTVADGKPQGVFAAPGAVVSLAFSPNNQTLAAACDDKSVVTWDAVFRPGQPVSAEFGRAGQVFAHAGAATGVTFAADNVTIYSAGLDKTAKAWRFASDLPVKNFGHGNLVDAVAFSPDGTQLATGSHEGLVRIWDVAKGQQLRQINAHIAPPAPSPVYCVAWSPDGKQIVSGSLDRSLKLWNAANSALIREFKPYKEKEFEKGHRDGVFCLAFSPDGKWIASGSSDHTIKLWNVADGTVVRDFINPKLKAAAAPAGVVPAPEAHPGMIYGLRFTAKGTRLISAGKAPRNRGYLAIWDVADGKLLHGEESELGAFYSVAVSPDGKFLALACGPRGRQFQEANAYVIKMPAMDGGQTTRAGR